MKRSIPQLLLRAGPQLLLLAALTLLLFAGSFGSGFVYDDLPVVVNNPHVQNETFAGLDFRIVRHATLVLDHRLFGDDPRGYHAHSLVWHLLCVFGVWALARRLFANPWLGFASAALFAVHPIHVEAVTGIANRKELLCLAFSLAAFLSYLRFATPSKTRASWGWLAVALLCWGLALASKEVAITLPLVVLAWEAWIASPEERFVLRHRKLLVAGAVVALALLAALPWIHPLDAEGLVESKTLKGYRGELSVSAVQLSSARSFVGYAERLVWPARLCPDHVVELSTHWLEPATALAWGALLAFAAFVVWLGSRVPVAAFGGAWFLAGFLPVSNLYPTAYLLADRYMYGPSVGFILFAVAGAAALWERHVPRGPRRARLAVASTLLVLGGLSVVTLRYNAAWHSEEALWAYTNRCEPDSYKAENSLGNQARDRGDTGAALAHYARAIELGSPLASFNRGSLLLERGRGAEALEDLARAAQNLPDRAGVHFVRGNALNAEAHYTQAVASYTRAIEIDPGDARYYNNRGAAWASLKLFGDAVADYERAISLDPEYADAHYNLGGALVATGQIDAARIAYTEAARLGNPAAERALRLLSAL